MEDKRCCGVRVDTSTGEECVAVNFLPNLNVLLGGVPFIEVKAPAFLDRYGVALLVRPHEFPSLSALREKLLEEVKVADVYVLGIDLVCVGSTHHYRVRYARRVKRGVEVTIENL